MFAFKVCKSANITLKMFFSPKNADFQSVEKVAKKLMFKKLSMKKWQKNRVFDFNLKNVVFNFYQKTKTYFINVS
jgi:hypothetical protein